MTTTDTDKKTGRGIEAMYEAFTPTGRLRWLKTGNSKALQQELRNVFTGKIEWRDVEIVTSDGIHD